MQNKLWLIRAARIQRNTIQHDLEELASTRLLITKQKQFLPLQVIRHIG
jgi:hypothetical protein